MKRNKALQYLKWVWVVAIIVFIGIFFYRNLPEAIQYLKSIPFWLVLVSSACITLAKLIIVYLALLSVNTGEWRPSYLYMFTIFTVSQLGKYIPGSIWHFAARINAYKENSLSNKKTAQVMLIENIWLATGAASFGILCLAIHHKISGDPQLFFVPLPEWLWNLMPLLILILWVIGLFLLDRRYPTSTNGLTVSRVFLLILVQAGIWLFLGLELFSPFPECERPKLFSYFGWVCIELDSWLCRYIRARRDWSAGICTGFPFFFHCHPPAGRYRFPDAPHGIHDH